MKFPREKERLNTAAKAMGERAMKKMPGWKTTIGRTTTKRPTAGRSRKKRN